MSSSSSSSSSSAALATVTVTARDIEFSNYNSATGKWGGAIMTMMILDADAQNNVSLKVYDEKVYAVFRNHDDPTDVIQFSAEEDGLDTRVTTSMPMVPSAKYELYKVYGQTSGSEYATSSQFYFQVPGKLWDFTNDTVDEDITLVSDWFNYGEVEDINGNVYGMPTLDDAKATLAIRDNNPIVINGNSINKSDIVRIKYTSLVSGDFTRVSQNRGGLGDRLENLRDIDIVSSTATMIGFKRNAGDSSLWSETRMLTFATNSVFNCRFALPETLTEIPPYFISSDNGLCPFNQPFRIPDSVTKVDNDFLYNERYFDSKMVFPYHDNLAIGNEFMYQSYRYTQPLDFHHHFASIGTYFMNQTGYPGEFTYPCIGNSNDATLDITLNNWAPLNTSNTFIVPDYYKHISGSLLYFAGVYSNVNGATLRVTDLILPSTLVSTTGELFQYTLFTNGFDADFATRTPNLKNLGNVGNSTYSSIRKITLPEGLLTCGNLAGNSSVYSNALDDFEFPSTLTTIGNFCCNWSDGNGNVVARLYDENNILKVPGTLTSIGDIFSRTTCWYVRGINVNPKYLDLSESRPEYFTKNGSFTANSFPVGSGTHSDLYNNWKITVAPGTSEEWAAKFPDIVVHNSSANRDEYKRHIEWVEQPVQYGRVFYRTYNGADSFGEEKHVDLQSASEINNLCFTSSTANTGPIGEEQVTLWNGVSTTGRNYITGFICGDDITTIPDNFLRSCIRIDREIKFGKNVVTIGNSCLQGAFDDSGGEMQNYIPSGHSQSVKFLGTSLTTIGQNFLHTARYFNADLTLPDGLTSIGYQFMLQTEHFNSNLTFPDSVTSFDARWFMCVPDKMTGTIDFGDMITSEMTSPMDALSTRDSTADCYTVGITIKGTNSTAIINKINNASSLGYRNLIDGGV